MSRHSGAIRLRHMLDHAREAAAIGQGKTRSDLSRERLLELALVRLVEIVGEAAARVPKETQSKYPSIPWPDLIGMRNKVIHEYDRVDLDILWNTVTVELPELVKQLERIVDAEKDV